MATGRLGAIESHLAAASVAAYVNPAAAEPALAADKSSALRLSEHHLSSWRGNCPTSEQGIVQEAKVCKHENPMVAKWPRLRFLAPDEVVYGRVIQHDSLTTRVGLAGGAMDGFIRAGACKNIYWDPQHIRAGLVTCGGLCPGLNSIIREVTRCLWHQYGVRQILGFQSGYNGFDTITHRPTPLNTDVVRDIHMKGGSILKAGRGGFHPDKICDTLSSHNINMLFVVGGDGTQWAADVLFQVAKQRHLPISIIGIPKSIDNDVLFFDRTFGFDSAVNASCGIIRNAWVEATSCHNGVGIVKLMGRDSGFVARNASLASTIVDCCLVPEVKWKLADLLSYIDETIRRKGHMVIVVAEGAAQDLVATGKKDATGHTVYGDIGTFLKKQIDDYLGKPGGLGGRCFYIDPSYIIRSVPATPNDHIYCTRMAYEAVHAAMRGYSGVCVGAVHNFMVMVPMRLIAAGVRPVRLGSSVWQACVQGAKMPASLAGLAADSEQPDRLKERMAAKKNRGNPEMFRKEKSKSK
eukprot:TRINITY_DN150_c0_g4_i1.p1 TRINITY_DN150_c0_g4~~TRINITY_DN150_c0_g4_i1.p1  ORF type:complete len:551 (+),score=156.70 TRINITY_DN150_c0_g4_i1:89-1654(+)